MGLPLLVLLVGCSQTAPEPVPDFVTYTPKYVDVVTAKIDQTTSGLTEVKSAVKENTEVLLAIKELVEQQPTGGVEPPESPSPLESSPPPVPYWETDACYVQYYGATWCGPCKTMKPRFRKLASKHGLPYTEFDVDRDRDAVRVGQVSQIPAIVVCRRGKQLERITGSVSEQTLTDLFSKYAPVQAVSQDDLVRLYDQLHNAESGLNTTWTGDLRTHLERDHGVEL